MILLEDTRNKINKHNLKAKYFEKNNITIKRTKLYVGDYTFPTNQSVCIDTKEEILEVVNNICGKNHERFRNELIRAQEANIKLVILIENEDNVKEIQDLFKWQNPRLHRYNQIQYMHNIGRWANVRLPKNPPTKGSTLAKAMFTMEKKYGCKFEFCRPIEAGKRIIELLEEN